MKKLLTLFLILICSIYFGYMAFPFISQAASTAVWQLTNLSDTFISPGLVNGTTKGIIVSASSTIGSGSVGLTINGPATTTGTAYFLSNVIVGTTSNQQVGLLHAEGSDSNVASNLASAVSLQFRNTNATNSNRSTITFASNDTAGASNPTSRIAGITKDHTAGALSGAIAFGTANASILIAERMRIDSNGNVGIGSTTPAKQLSVQGDGLISGTLSAANIMATGTLTVTSIADGCTQTVGGLFTTTGSACASSLIGTQGQVAYFSGTNTAVGTSSLFVDSMGEVGVGSTSPNARLAVHLNPTDVQSLSAFQIGSSTATATTTLFAIDNTGAMTYGGVTLNPNVTGTGNLALSAGPTFTGVLTSITITNTGGLRGGTAATSQLSLRGTSNTAPTTAAIILQSSVGATAGATESFRIMSNTGYGAFGSTSPFANLSIHANPVNFSTVGRTLFAIGSSTATATTTFLAVDNTSHLIRGGDKPSLSSCGTTNSISGSDDVGTIMLVGTLVTTCTETFVTPVPSSQVVSCIANGGASGLSISIATSTTQAIYTLSGTVSAATIFYQCTRYFSN